MTLSARRIVGRPVRRSAFATRPVGPLAPAVDRLQQVRSARSGWARRWEPWRDWAVLTVLSQGTLVLVAVIHPALPWVLAWSVVLGALWASSTLTVLHDAGHRRFGRRPWLGVLAVQTAVPAGLWVGHWTLKHRIHHRLTQVFPFDEPTRSSSLVRLHPEARWRRMHRYQHQYAWFLYALAWASELKSQLTYLRTGNLAGDTAPSGGRRAVSFVAEKVLCAAILAPYAVALGWVSFCVLLIGALSVASALAAVITAVGHINVGVAPEVGRPSPEQWAGHVVRTTASFSTGSAAMRWVTGAMTHHLAHHLRPAAPRTELVALHLDAVQRVAARAGEQVVEFPSLASAVRGHWLRLRELGRPVEQRLPAGTSAGALEVGLVAASD